MHEQVRNINSADKGTKIKILGTFRSKETGKSIKDHKTKQNANKKNIKGDRRVG